MPKRQQNVQSRSCPYLDTINRHVLDFDFEKLCSVSLSHLNAYACLVCGKYFQGRGTNTYAYTHSVDSGHRVFLNLQTLRFYCLPDNYEIIDPSLEDIKYVLQPTFAMKQISGLDSNTKLSRAYDGTTYYPGIVGLNNIKANDYCNVILHALSHIAPLRNYFLREENYSNVVRLPGDKLVLLYQRFGELLRKLWNPRNFKAHVSPHEMLQAVVLCSEKRFQITKQGDAIDFLSWLLNTLHVSLNGAKKNNSSIIYQTFRGRMRSYTRKVLPTDADEEDRARLLLLDEYKEVMEEVPFLYLTLDLPSAPLYRGEFLQNVIPQVPLSTLLAKFNGTTEKEYKTYNENIVKRFEIVQLPRYLIMFVKRFTKNQWFIEKNPTIVNFPIKNVDLYECLASNCQSKHKFTTYDLIAVKCSDPSMNRIKETNCCDVDKTQISTIANVVHDGKPGSNLSSYRIQLLHKGTSKWFELEDLHVKEILPQMITLTESYIQVWELNTTKTREQRQDESEENADEEILDDLYSLSEQLLEHYNGLNMFSNKVPLPVSLLKNHNATKSCYSQKQCPKDDDVQLQFPGKIACNSNGSVLAITDSGHHRVLLVDTKTGKLLNVAGRTEAGYVDGNFVDARFTSPQGITWLNDDILFVADTETHTVRKIDLASSLVSTVGGLGYQGSDLVGGNNATTQVLNSPWDSVLVELEIGKESLFIAAAGSHQLWILPLNDDITVGKRTFLKNYLYAFAGSGKEAAKNNLYSHLAAFAQPSGLSVDHLNKTIFVADSESSTIRSVDIKTGAVKHLIGGDKNPENLFAFGDKDGIGYEVKLQHPIGLAYCSQSELLYIADTYNNKVKIVDPKTNHCKSVFIKDTDDNLCSLNEPAGISFGDHLYIADTNNHRILKVDPASLKTKMFKISKSADNKINAAKEEVDCGKIRLHSVTANNSAVSLLRNNETTGWFIRFRIRMMILLKTLVLSEDAPQSRKITATGSKLIDESGNVSDTHSGSLNVSNEITELPRYEIVDTKSDKIEINVKLNAFVCDKIENICKMRKCSYNISVTLDKKCSDLENLAEIIWKME